MKKLLIFISIIFIISACSSSKQEQNSCVGKTIKSIQEDFSSTTITFTDDSYMVIGNNEWKATYVKVYKNKK